jgi:prevent-host-death family protein
MPESGPITQAVSASEAVQQWEKLLEKVHSGQTRLLLKKDGVPLAALVSVGDLEHLERLEKQREEAFEVIDRMRAAFADVPEEELDAEVDKAIAEVRAEMAAERTRTPK